MSKVLRSLYALLSLASISAFAGKGYKTTIVNNNDHPIQMMTINQSCWYQEDLSNSSNKTLIPGHSTKEIYTERNEAFFSKCFWGDSFGVNHFLDFQIASKNLDGQINIVDFSIDDDHGIKYYIDKINNTYDLIPKTDCTVYRYKSGRRKFFIKEPTINFTFIVGENGITNIYPTNTCI